MIDLAEMERTLDSFHKYTQELLQPPLGFAKSFRYGRNMEIMEKMRALIARVRELEELQKQTSAPGESIGTQESSVDRNMIHIAKMAQTCLQHVRNVKWGEGGARYEVDDGALRIVVNLSVLALGEAKQKPAE